MEQKFSGVTTAKKKNQTIYYRASVTYKRKHISLGSYKTMESAHLAYLEASRILADGLITLHNFNSAMLLSFDKWVSLINYRDNGIYFNTPIYTRKNFFNYYLSPTIELIFDVDDLFYYSSHKIMKRGGHLFVADYGMQVSLASRYGIKNYSVLDRDYRFINGNHHDYRYENIEIINRYHGVTRISQNGVTKYSVKIHIRSYYQVGCYLSEEKAAVAYNKAIDILRDRGIVRNYTPNYIENLSDAAYAELYAKVRVSQTLYRLPATLNRNQQS